MIIFCLLFIVRKQGFLGFVFLPVIYLDLYFCSSLVKCKKKKTFIVHSKKSNNHESKNETVKLK